MSKILIGALAAIVISAGAAVIVAASGLVDTAADVPHNPLVHRAMEFIRERSIARRAADLELPGDFGAPERLRRGAGNYDAMCVDCHLAPDMPDSEIRKGLYPRPPKLASAGRTPAPPDNPARDFWIIKHGIKASGMPAWSKGGMEDGAIWDLAAFVQKLPTLSRAEYDKLVAASDGHAHGGVDNAAASHDGHESPASLKSAPKPAVSPMAAHSHGAHPH